jgi:radical SAM superfamily enzyme YgiQ (UPF0313 family)
MIKMSDNLEQRTNALFLSAPYPGDQKFGGQPTGLLYAISVLANRKEAELGSKDKVAEQVEVWCPEGVIDFASSKLKEELTNHFGEKRPKLVGISTFSVSYQNAIEIKDHIKDISPKTVVVFGGAHEDNFVKHYRADGQVEADFVVAGDGPYLLDSLYQIIENNSGATVEGIKEAVLRNKDQLGDLAEAGVLLFNYERGLEEVFTQTVVESNKRRPIRLDDIPLTPRYLLKDEEEVSSQFDIFEGMTAQVMVGQGCAYSCGFCSEGIGRTWFDEDSPKSVNPARNLEHFKRELDALREAGYRSIFFDDSTFFAKSKGYMRGVLNLLQQAGFEWGCQTTQSSIHAMRDLLPAMKDSGFKYVYVGVEHFDGDLRDSFGKTINAGNKFGAHSVESTLDLLLEHNISTGVSLTFGHPDPSSEEEVTRENETTARYAIDRVSELVETYQNLDGVSLNLITYHPGTPISERHEKKVGSVDYVGHPNSRKVFGQFEEGIGPHAPGMTEELANEILVYAREKLGDKLWL